MAGPAGRTPAGETSAAQVVDIVPDMTLDGAAPVELGTLVEDDEPTQQQRIEPDAVGGGAVTSDDVGVAPAGRARHHHRIPWQAPAAGAAQLDAARRLGRRPSSTLARKGPVHALTPRLLTRPPPRRRMAANPGDAIMHWLVWYDEETGERRLTLAGTLVACVAVTVPVYAGLLALFL